MAAFPSDYPLSQTSVKMEDPFSGRKSISVEYPSLKEFLKITKLSKYESKLKRLKYVETADLKHLSGNAGLQHVEEQRIKRYLDHFNLGKLTIAEEKKQPMSLTQFFSISKLEEAEKVARKVGAVEFDDLQFISYSDRAMMFKNNKVEINRFERYYQKIADSTDIDDLERERATMVSNLKVFFEETKLKSYKSAFQKLGVTETDDLLSLDRFDMKKLKQVEWERLTRYREKYRTADVSRKSSAATSPSRENSWKDPQSPTISGSAEQINFDAINHGPVMTTPPAMPAPVPPYPTAPQEWVPAFQNNHPGIAGFQRSQTFDHEQISNKIGFPLTQTQNVDLGYQNQYPPQPPYNPNM